MQNNQIAIVHQTASPCNELTNITFRNHIEYALKHGYILQEVQLNPDAGNKLSMLGQVLENTDIHRAFWIDSDAVFTNPELRLTDHLPQGKVVMACDIFGPSADCLWVENCPEVRRLLWAASQVAAWALHGDDPGIMRFREQTGLRYLSLHPPYQDLFTYVDHRLMKSHKNEYYLDGRPEDGFGQWQPGDFILHLGGLPPVLQISILESALGLVGKGF